MIIVTIDLVSALTGNVTTLGRMVIANDGTEKDPNKGNYIFGVKRKDMIEQHNLVPVAAHTSRSGRIVGHPRKSDVIWKLILRCLKAAYPEV